MEINIKLTLEQANTVLMALGELPYSKVDGLISSIKKQGQEQIDIASEEEQPVASE